MSFHLLVILLIIGCLFSCISFPKYSNPGVKIVHDIQRENNKKLVRYGIYSYTTGGHSTGNIIIDGRYVTNCYRFTSIDEARAFFCAFFDWYVQPFKDEPRIRPYLYKLPVTEKNFEFSIAFIDKNYRPLQRPYIEEISCCNNKIYYSTHDPSAGPAVSKAYPVLLVETFEEARERLKNGEKQLPEITKEVMEKLFHLSIQGNDI